MGGIQETVIEKAVLQASLSESLNGFGVHIINVSAGSDGTDEMIDVYQTAWRNGVVLVASRGNSNGSLSNHVQYPSCLNDPWVISVGAIALNGERREDSFYENVDVMAPGDATQVITLKHDDINDVIGFGKTSAAAPHVAGLAALILSSQNTTRYIDVPNLCGEDVEFLIERNATPINSDPIVGSLLDINDYTGPGLIDADATIGNFRYPITRIYHSSAPTSKYFTHNSSETVSFEKNVGDFEAGVPYTAERREIVFTFEVQFDPTTEIIEFWPRYYNCVGVNDDNLLSKEYHVQFDSPVLGSNETTVNAITNTWYFPTLSQWYPVHPNQVRVAFSLLIQDVTLGVNTIDSEADFRIYPNPAGAEFSIDLGNFNGDCEKIELYSMEGKQVYSRNISKTDGGDKYTVCTRSLNNGVYVCRVLTTEGIVERKLVIVN